MKLFLNSFFNKNYEMQAEVINMLTKRISKKCNSEVKIVSKSSFKTFDRNNFTNKPGLLVYKGFRSICPVTSQPDWGNIYIYSSTDTIKKKDIYGYQLPKPTHFYNSLTKGLPPSAGIAMGVERLLMAIHSRDDLFFN